jgi:hypothetical protein
MSDNGADRFATKAGCSESQVSLATSPLTRAPDLAEAVSARQPGLSRASAMARQREPSPSASSLTGDTEWLPSVPDSDRGSGEALPAPVGSTAPTPCCVFVP